MKVNKELALKNNQEQVLYLDICSMIENSKSNIALAISTEICSLHWYIGKRIKECILLNKRAEYGKRVLFNLSIKLTEKYGKGWSLKSLQHCLHFVEIFKKEEIVSTLWRQFNWSQLKVFMYIKEGLKRSFYMELCKLEHWDVRTLSEKIDSQLYERTALSKKPESLIKKELSQVKKTGNVTPDIVFRSSYFLDMLGLSDTYSEKDLEDAIVVQLQSFIKELGNDFAFLERQKRISIDSVDYYLDLLFYHRSLQRLVAIELKLGKFKPQHEGQMLLYLRYLDKNERKEYEKSPIGLILCSEGNTEHIEYFMLEKSNIKVAQYYTQLPNKKVLSEKLQKAIAVAREHYAEKILNKEEV
jgi:predicted nuclease of restriction endonuclease-like (RecB) superfamily